MYKWLLLALCVTEIVAFEISPNPLKQIENAERNREAVWSALRSVFSGWNKNSNDHGNGAQSNGPQHNSNNNNGMYAPQDGNNNNPTHASFRSMAGNPPQAFLDLRDYLLNTQKYLKMGVRPFKGILLVGPPGSGKTSWVRALAEETGCALIATAGSEFGAILKGVGMLQIKKLFNDARQKSRETRKPTIIFFDDFDAIGSRNDYRADPQTIGELLNQLDGYEQNDSFIVVAATNNPEQLDPGLKRRGRFDKTIEIGYPDEQSRGEILYFYLQKRNYDQSINIQYFASQTQNFTPADLRVMVEAATMNAVRNNRSMVTHEDLLEAMKETATSIALGGDKKHQLKKMNTDPNAPRGFEMLAGSINQDIMDLVMQLKFPERFVALGIERPRGFLFVGPPGSGKTSLARAIAEETDCDFIACSASEFIEVYVGVGAQRVRELFEEARKRAQQNNNKVTIVFIDDLDAIGRRTAAPGDTETQRTLVELLNQLDGFNKDTNIVVIGATNNPMGIDPALKRPGRFEVIIEVPLPDAEKRSAILEHYCKDRPLGPDVHLDEYAMHADGFSPADLKMLINQAAKCALRDDSKTINRKHFDLAFEFMQHRRELAEEEYLQPGYRPRKK